MSGQGESTEKSIYLRGRERVTAVLGAQTPQGPVVITLSNLLTLSRLAVVPFFWYLFFAESLTLEMTVTVLFIAGAISDLWDGKIARRRGEVTEFGDFMDPLVDKIFILSGFWAVLVREEFYHLTLSAYICVVLITLREIALTIARVKSITSGKSLRTSIWGKWKVGVQLTCLIFAMVAFNVRDYLVTIGFQGWPIQGLMLAQINTILIALSMLTSLISGWLYLNESLEKRRK